MKTRLIVLDIPKPCHEDWGQMDLTERGKICNACKTEVIDFSKYSESNLIHFFENHQGSVCGRINVEKLNTAILLSPESNLSGLYKWVAGLMFIFLSVVSKIKAQCLPFESDSIFTEYYIAPLVDGEQKSKQEYATVEAKFRVKYKREKIELPQTQPQQTLPSSMIIGTFIVRRDFPIDLNSNTRIYKFK